jgi:hypothetical protein
MIGMDSKPLGQYWRRGEEGREGGNLVKTATLIHSYKYCCSLFSGKEFSRILCNPKFYCCVGFEVLRVMSKTILYSGV